jgi:hypothetical protein
MRSVNEYLTEEKLTTEERDKLSNSVFCGPGRSFPCHDCKHVRAARAFLDRSHFSESTKKRIRTCINRKAKELGCD